ncbi:hypothetical protein LEMLEM_LOCUS685, partial [Lemmus lemmus]
MTHEKGGNKFPSLLGNCVKPELTDRSLTPDEFLQAAGAVKICGPDMRSGAPRQRLHFSSDLGMPLERWSWTKPERRASKMPGRQAR